MLFWTFDHDAILRRLHAEGKTDREIAEVIHIGRKTVGHHRRQLGLPGHHSSQATRVKQSIGLKKAWAEKREKMLAVSMRNLGRRRRRPPPDTQEGREFRKIAKHLGSEAAHAALNKAQP